MNTPIYVTKNEEAIRKSFTDFKNETILGSIKKEEELGEKRVYSDSDILAACIFRLCEILESRIFHLIDLLANPISAAMQGRVFPKGHANELAFWLKYCGVLDSIFTDPDFNGKLIKIPDSIREHLATPCNKLQDILECMEADDVGTSKGYKCIHDYWHAVDAIKPEFDTVMKEVRDALPKPPEVGGSDV